MSDNMISTFNTGLPPSVKFLDIPVSSFTLAATSTGNNYEVTGSRRQVFISSAKNVTKANATDDRIATIFWWHLSALITSNTTDSCGLSAQYSTDGGGSWNFVTGCTATLTNASQNESVSQSASGANGVLFTIEGNAITNPLLFRLVIEDATDPTTDVLTITNVRATLAMMVMA